MEEKISNGAQFLNATCAASASGCWGWVSAGEPAGMAIIFVTIIFPVTKIYASE